MICLFFFFFNWLITIQMNTPIQIVDLSFFFFLLQSTKVQRMTVLLFLFGTFGNYVSLLFFLLVPTNNNRTQPKLSTKILSSQPYFETLTISTATTTYFVLPVLL